MTSRDQMEAAVRRELVGPAGGEPPRGRPIDLSHAPITFASWEEARGPRHDAATGEEVLSEVEPLRRYGIGVLHSQGRLATESISGVPGLPETDTIDDSPPAAQPLGAAVQPEADSDDFDLSDANSFQPSAMAITFRVGESEDSSLRIEVRAAAYERFPIQVIGSEHGRNWYVRRPLTLAASVTLNDLIEQAGQLVRLAAVQDGPATPAPQLQAYLRPVPDTGNASGYLITVALVNTDVRGGSAGALFQCSLKVAAEGSARIQPYPEPPSPDGADEEADSIALLYRQKPTFAVGHGCAAEWEEPAGGTTAAVRAEPLPAYEVPSLTPDISWVDGTGRRQVLAVSMAALAEYQADGEQQVEQILDLYERWIADRQGEVSSLESRYRPAASRHIELCRDALRRMRAGWKLVQTDSLARHAFRIANQAMLYQQVRSRLPTRDVSVTDQGLLAIGGQQPDGLPLPGTGYWRPFQIAFLLACLPELVYQESAERGTVDLIFFPTGGGKTEAYLGAAAISMIARRLRNPADAGTEVLMRYTLRLLTAQQFLRAAALICVLEDIRRQSPALGTEPFSIGIWLGSATTPNTRREAIAAHGQLQNRGRVENPFLLLRCPWCGTRMGPVTSGRRRQIAGYVRVGQRVAFRCPDISCRFGNRNGLPIFVVDEDVYERRPTLVIGTVDKFATLAWRPEARSIFGLSSSGQRLSSPPGLIIQDELHLISGPLGSMAGLYEPVIEDICTDHRLDPPILPKIVASTATIRRYEKQVRDLYGRSRVALFPPHGLEEGRSFFAEPAASPDGSPAPGRRYLGIMSASLGSIQTVQVRVAAATLQAGLSLDEGQRDGYWTNLNFLNSLRELGNTVSLLQSDIPDYLTGMRKRDGIDPKGVRWPKIVLELTGRRRSDEIPRAIDELSLPYGAPGCVDICLASNIIEVGVDIDRLSLMTIVGQPKTTAQYIQVSGRVGRRWWDRPGLVLTIYGAAKPRDRSHYERFRSYHQQLYAQVEPTTVTPFALPALQRGLHGAVISHVRQTAPADLPVYPFPEAEFGNAVALLLGRAQIADSTELAAVREVARQRAREWGHWGRTEWSANPQGGDPKQGLMLSAGTSLDPRSTVPVWEVPTSMRSVDAECALRITDAYAIAAADPAEEEPV